MENNTFPILPFQEGDDVSISCPDFTVSWDVGMNPISYPGFSLQGTGDDVADNNRKGKKPKQDQRIYEGGTSNQEAHKKKMHREIERQRRQEMSTLYSSLRSVLPSQFLKGKRSICDQIHEATNYIGCLQDNIRELGIKRDNIKRMSKNELQESDNKGGYGSQISPVFVSVQRCCVGVEVLISCTDSTPEGLSFPISKILKALLEEGLGLVSCNLTVCDGSLSYVIQSEVLDNAGVDLQMLQTKLNGMARNMLDMKQ